jgi:predicted SAM-dependent methyltransferase
MIRLNLGCGYNHLPQSEGWINIDKSGVCNPDLALNLPFETLPFNEGEVNEVNASHVLEHVTNLPALMRDLYRVMAPGALLRIATPHWASDGFTGDPTHTHPVTLNTIRLFSKKFCAEVREKGWPNTPLAEYWDVDFEVDEFQFKLFPEWEEKRLQQKNIQYCITHYINVVDELLFVVRRV